MYIFTNKKVLVTLAITSVANKVYYHQRLEITNTDNKYIQRKRFIMHENLQMLDVLLGFSLTKYVFYKSRNQKPNIYCDFMYEIDR